MNEFVCKLIDRWAIRAAAAGLPRPTGADPHVQEARRLLESPDFFAEDTPAAAMTFTGGKNFQFPSPVVTASAENNLVTGRMSRRRAGERGVEMIQVAIWAVAALMAAASPESVL